MSPLTRPSKVIRNAAIGLRNWSRRRPVASKIGIVAEEREFIELILSHFDPTYYLETNRDVANAAVVPLEHWLTHGVREGRQISRAAILRFGKSAIKSSGRNWRHYRWRGTDVAVRLISPIPREVITQILNQARHDPAVLGPGKDVISSLRQHDREDVGLDLIGLQRAMRPGMEILLIVPDLKLTNQREFTRNLIAALNEASFRSVQTLVLEEEQSPEHFSQTIPEPFCGTSVSFWPDFLIEGPHVFRLAQLVAALRPKATIVAHSQHADEVIARYGRALSEYTRLYWIYDGAAQAVEFASRFARGSAFGPTVLTDDETLVDMLCKQAGHARDRIVVLSGRSQTALIEAARELFRLS